MKVFLEKYIKQHTITPYHDNSRKYSVHPDKLSSGSILFLTLKMPITTAVDDEFWNILPNF